MKARSSGLFYHGTSEEVRLGDVVRVKKMLWGYRIGTVCYIPGLSPHHPHLDYEGSYQWAIRWEDGGLGLMGYWPENKYGQPSWRITLLHRGEEVSISPDEQLEE